MRVISERPSATMTRTKAQPVRSPHRSQPVGREESWGYRSDEDYYTDRHLMREHRQVPGPGRQLPAERRSDAQGTIAPEAAAILKRIGQWYRARQRIAGEREPASHLHRQPQRAADSPRQYALRPPVQGSDGRGGETQADHGSPRGGHAAEHWRGRSSSRWICFPASMSEHKPCLRLRTAGQRDGRHGAGGEVGVRSPS